MPPDLKPCFEDLITGICSGAHTASFCASSYPTEDRLVVEEWNLSSGSWKFLAIFDGHGAGVEAVEFVLSTLSPIIKKSIIAADTISDDYSSIVSHILVQSILDVDEQIKDGITRLFPGGVDEISQMTDDGIRQCLRDPTSDCGKSHIEILRARTGTTALVALLDPVGYIHVASLGDCEALIYYPSDKDKQSLVCEVLSIAHRCSNATEALRLTQEHPSETCIDERNGRLLSSIPLTRSIGDYIYKLPPIYTTRVMALASPPFHPNYAIAMISSKNLTPPYISNLAQVKHFNVSTLKHRGPVTLIMSSDGLPSLYESRKQPFKESVQRWLERTNTVETRFDNLSKSLLWDALGGNEDESLPCYSHRVDDTSIIVLQV